MFTKQLSIFIENRPGRLAEVTKIIADKKINLRALSIGDTTNFGILRLIVDNASEVEAMLKEEGMTVSLTSVIAVKIHDRPGALADVLGLLNKENIAIEYMYAFLSQNTADSAYVVMRIDEDVRAVKVLTENGYEGPSIN